MYGDYIAYDCWLGKVYDLKNQVILKLSNGARYFSPSCGRLSPLAFTILICFMRTRNSFSFIYIMMLSACIIFRCRVEQENTSFCENLEIH